MANKLPAFHAPFPMRFAVDNRVTGTAARLLGLYCWHDRLSLTRGAGNGCTASNKKLCARLGCDYTTLLKLRKGLEDWGYIEATRGGGQYRREVVRVIPDHLAEPGKWPFDPAYIGSKALVTWGMDPQKAGQLASFANPEAGEAASNAPEKAGEGRSENGGNLPKTDDQHMLPSKETYSSEEGEHIPLEEAHSSGLPVSAGSLGLNLGAGRKGRTEPAEAGLGSKWSLVAHLPRNFTRLPAGAQVSRLEGAFNNIGRDPDRLDSRERETFCGLLAEIAEAFPNEAHGQQAQRLSEEMMVW